MCSPRAVSGVVVTPPAEARRQRAAAAAELSGSQAWGETNGQIRTLPVSISYGFAPGVGFRGRNVPFASAASMSLALLIGVKLGLLNTVGLYMSKIIFHGPLNSPAVPLLPRPGAPVNT